GVEHDERLARRDPDADLEVEPAVALVQVCDGFGDRKARPNGTLGVVLTYDRSSEKREHRIADELLHRAAEALELCAHARVVRPEHRTHVFGIELLGAGGRADHVYEQPGDELALLAWRRSFGERRAT